MYNFCPSLIPQSTLDFLAATYAPCGLETPQDDVSYLRRA